MKRILIASLFLNQICFGYTITHTDYTAGTTITAAAQNTNENNIVTLLNGNIDNTNITANSITGTQINTATTITAATVNATSNLKYNGASFGKFLQIVSTNTNSAGSSQTSSSFADLPNMAITLTPLSAASTLYITVCADAFANGATSAQFELYNGSNVSIAPGAVPNAIISGNASVSVESTLCFEQPYFYGSVTPLQIKLRMASSDNSHQVQFNRNNAQVNFMIIKEILF